MSGVTHTPGPWKCVEGNAKRKFDEISIRPVNSPVKGLVLPVAAVRYPHHKFGQANARLIAAAPDMLEVLIEVDRENSAALAGMKDDDIQPPNWFVDQCQKVKDAIAKATGETP